MSVLSVELLTDPLLKGYAALWPTNPGAILTILNAPGSESMIQSRMISARTVLAEAGPTAGDILDRLSTAGATIPAVKWALTFLGQEQGLDIGSAVAQQTIGSLVAQGVLTSAEGTILSAMAMLPCSRAMALGLAPVTLPDIYAAMGA